jgi:leader peptidase (prepilin peptidase)/N-methyltransferase
MDKLPVFLAGLITGSFLNVCIFRIPKKESIIFPPSHCTECGKKIEWYHNIPLLSYIVLKGRCAHCGRGISGVYPLVELLTALLLVALYTVFGPGVKFVAYAALVCALIVATFIDLFTQEIPDSISLGGTVCGLLAAASFPGLLDADSRASALMESFLGALAGGGAIYLMGVAGKVIFKKDAMGGGDVKLMAMIGAFLGWKQVLLVFFTAPLFGAAAGIALKIKDGRDIIPYGPYISMAAVLAIFFGKDVLRILFWGL